MQQQYRIPEIAYHKMYVHYVLPRKANPTLVLEAHAYLERSKKLYRQDTK